MGRVVALSGAEGQVPPGHRNETGCDVGQLAVCSLIFILWCPRIVWVSVSWRISDLKVCLSLAISYPTP